MAGQKNSIFNEKLTPYLKNLMSDLEVRFGKNSNEYLALAHQYVKNSLEDQVRESDRLRHYQAEFHISFEGKPLRGVERLYRRTMIIEPSSVCAAHCRWCLRGQYPIFSLTEEDLDRFSRFCGSPEVSTDLREILITGGDPFMIPRRLKFLVEKIKENAPNIEIFRIASRVPVQDPQRIDLELLEIFRAASPIRVEIATHVNHPAEFTAEAIQAYKKLKNEGCVIYNQTVLLKGVNDDPQILIELFDQMRYIGIETHYLFHCIPMRGMAHHRTSVGKGLEIISKITSSGGFSGRAKPMFTLMTDIGKITPYHGTLIKKDGENNLLLQSSYRVEDFVKRNPSWKKPDSAIVDSSGFLQVWYPDGFDN